MKLSDRQWRFTIDSSLLTAFIAAKYPGMKAPLREVQRTTDQQKIYHQKGLTETQDSKHLDCLAEDRAFYVNGVWLGDWLEDDVKDYLQPIGDYWESLTPGNRWGGNFLVNGKPDVWHFEAA